MQYLSLGKKEWDYFLVKMLLLLSLPTSSSSLQVPHINANCVLSIVPLFNPHESPKGLSIIILTS